jgi:hypothetical protein
MNFSLIETWGHARVGTIIVDNVGTRYIVEPQNESGFLKLRNLSGGQDEFFEALDAVDHLKFKAE